MLDLVSATLFASRARDIGDSTSRINNKSKHLRWRTDPKPRRIVSIIQQRKQSLSPKISATCIYMC